MLQKLDDSTPVRALPRRAGIDRPRLIAQLSAAVSRPVTLIAAPAGYGKSTLVAQWLASADAPALQAWLCLDAADNHPAGLWTHLIGELDRIGCEVDVNAAELRAQSGGAMGTRMVPRVVDALAAPSEPVTLVLEDCHLVRSADCTALLDQLIERLPSNVQLILIARSDPALRLGRLRVEGRLAEIRSGDLSFTVEETREVLETEGLELFPEALAELVARTEGWPAAIYLAALSLRGRDEPDAFVRELNGNDRFIADYLWEEVLNRQEPVVRDFILDMSVFEHFNGSLGDFVREAPDSGRLIRELERTNLFLTPLDSAGGWYRFQHLFGSFARSALEAADRDRLTALHLRGAEWFRSHDHIDEAVRHAVAAGSDSWAAELVQRNWARFFDTGRAATVRGWLTTLEGSPADQAAPVAATAAWLAALTGQQDELARRLVLLESLPQDEPLPDGTTSVRSAVALIRGLFGSYGPDRMLAEAEIADRLETNPASPWYAVARSVWGHASYIVGDLSAARAGLTEAANAAAAPTPTRIFALGMMSLCDLELGDVASHHALAKLAMQIAVDQSMEAMPSSLVAFTAVGASRLTDGDVDGALNVLDEGLRMRRQVTGLSPWPLVHHLIVMVTAAARANRRSLAETLLAELEQLAHWPDASTAVMRAKISSARAELVDRRYARTEFGEPLTPREEQLLRRLRGSQSLREISHDLYVSLNTVKTITSSIYRKLGVHSREQAVTLARTNGLFGSSHDRLAEQVQQQTT